MHTHMYTSGRVRRRRGGVEGKGRRYSIHKVNFAAEEEKEELFTTFINSCSEGQEHQGDAGGGEGMFSRGRRTVAPQRRNCSMWWEGGGIWKHYDTYTCKHACTYCVLHTHTHIHTRKHTCTHTSRQKTSSHTNTHAHAFATVCTCTHQYHEKEEGGSAGGGGGVEGDIVFTWRRRNKSGRRSVFTTVS